MDGQTALTTAIIAATVALAVAGVTNAVSLVTGWRQRKHERELAATERQFQRRADAYVEALTLIAAGMDWVNRTMPVIGPAPEPPASPDDDVIRRANALVSLFGSPETREGMAQLAKQQHAFALEVDTHESAKAAGRAHGGSDEPASWRRIEDTRRECRRLRDEVEEAMRRDLSRT